MQRCRLHSALKIAAMRSSSCARVASFTRAAASAPGCGQALLRSLRDAAAARRALQGVTMEHSGSVAWPAASPAWTALRAALLASVHTDLPQPPGAPQLPVALSEVPPDVRSALPAASVQAVAAHARSASELAARFAAVGALRPAGVLLVSGDTTTRSTTAASSAATLLRGAARLRADDTLPDDTALLVAANPLLETDTSSLQAKLDAGAEGVVTQPALLPLRASRWWEVVAPLMQGTPVLLGVACITSPREIELWLRLAGVPATDADARQLLSTWHAAAAGGPAALEAHARRAALAAVRHAAGLQGIAGVHIMPLTRAGYALAADVLAPELQRLRVS